MARLVHLNGPPGIGKSTLSALHIDRHPGTLNLDIDTLHRLVGGWQNEQTDNWPAVWSLARAMAAAHLDGGHDVVLPQYSATLDQIRGFEELARRHGAGFREIVLLDDRQPAIDRFHHRAATTEDPWVRHHHELVERGGGPVVLGRMYDELMAVVQLLPSATVVPSVPGEPQKTYELLEEALSR
ncbi:AAA family ATPase [Actinoplanes sp. M2I2]|uniref:AAA family ATPase n=1 Tax=Actinoplanes sp. M2I2 TaxID=1734444 RepID=UPI0020221671|nr:AAA family ATPase [Actinoplanes sp. M2I2]